MEIVSSLATKDRELGTGKCPHTRGSISQLDLQYGHGSDYVLLLKHGHIVSDGLHLVHARRALLIMSILNIPVSSGLGHSVYSLQTHNGHPFPSIKESCLFFDLLWLLSHV